jgi:FMN phosphatase YigB (HAD superfamily)/glycosyltransferase involved in cell wall biosynthesis
MKTESERVSEAAPASALNLPHGGELPEDVSALFSKEHYLRQLKLKATAATVARLEAADTAQAYSHWVKEGVSLGLDPHPLFSISHYLEQTGLTPDELVDPIADYLRRGPESCISPSPYFDAAWYLRTHGDVASARAHPLLHFLRHGVHEGRSPSGSFNLKWYATHYPDVKKHPGGPLLHYIAIGEAERRFRSPLDLAMAEHVGSPLASALEFNVDSPALAPDAAPVTAGHEPSPLPLVPLTGDVKLLSLDIWDTVLFRRCHPDAIKLSSGRLLFVNHRWRLRPAYRDIQALYRQRRAAEDASSKTDDFEYRYDDAVSHWLEVVLEHGTPQGVVQQIHRQLLQHEFDMECRASYLSQAFQKFMGSRPKHLPMVFASDFYMSSGFLGRLLASKGVDNGFARIYASSDAFQNKRGGQLYETIAQDFAIAPSQIVHVGDNAKADVAAAAARSVRGYLYSCAKTEAARHRHAAVFDSVMDGTLAQWGLELRHLLTKAAEQLGHDDGTGATVSAERASAQHTGVYLTPLVVGFLLHVIEQAKLFGVKTIYFCTREGVFFEQAYKALVAANPYLSDYPDSKLLEVSRIATFAASLKEWSEAELLRLWSLYSTQSPAAFLSSLNFSDPWFTQAFRKAGLPLDEPIQYPWKNASFVKLIFSPEFKAKAEAQIRTQRELMLGYLAERGFVADKSPKLVVDIGWRGSIHDNLAQLCSDHIHGCYFGLFKYVNPQPRNTSKSAWLFDFNASAPWRQELEVAPIEMLFNASGGSVAGYDKTARGFVARRVVDAQEDGVFERFTRHFQASVVRTIAAVADYTALTGTTSTAFVPIGRALFDRLLDDPPQLVSEAFLALSHNETFGTGGFYAGPSREKLNQLVGQLNGSDLHLAASTLLKSARWPTSLRGLVRLDGTQAPPVAKLRHLPSRLMPTARVAAADGIRAPRIGFVIPPPIIGSGGHRTIFNVARKFVDRGCEVFCFLEGEGDGVAVAHEMLGHAKAHVYVGWQHSAALDVAFATIAHSARFVAAMPNVGLRAYLVQDLEALFNPVGDAYTVAENSYALGLTHFTIGNWLTDIIAKQYGAVGIPAGLGVDTGIYQPMANAKRESAVCFLYQPEKPRRNTQLLIDALRLVKRARPDVRLFGYGSNAAMPRLDFEVENLGLIRELDKLNQLYNQCAVGVCLSMSNPSRIPFELMAAGAIPVDLYRYNNLFDYDDGTILLTYQSPHSLAAGVVSLLDASPQVEARRKACIEFARSRTSDWETDVIVNSVLLSLRSGNPKGDVVRMRYSGTPLVAPEDASAGVKKFCDWQRHLAAAG